ncbi:lyase family protein [Glutamicibacter sp. X7]
MSARDYGLLAPAWAGTEAAELTDDTAFVQGMLDVEAAWVRVQGAAGLCPAEQVQRVQRAAQVRHYDLHELAQATPAGANALIPLLGMVRTRLSDEGAPVPTALHRGCTSQDIIDSALMLSAARTVPKIRAAVRRTATALAALAEEHRHTLCIARSLTQHALPTTFGLRAANWLAALRAAAQRLDTLSFPLQFGGAAGTLASLDQFLSEDHDATSAELGAALAQELGLEYPLTPWHTNRQPILDLSSALGGVLAALGTFGADVLTAARPEVGELSEPHAAGAGGSSAMPQKRNPVHSILLREAALSSPGLISTLFTAAGTAVDERPDGSWHAEWSALRELLRLTGGAAEHAATLAEGLVVHPDKLEQNLRLGGDAVLSERMVTVLADRYPGGAAAIRAEVVNALDGGPTLRQRLRRNLPVEQFSDAALDALFDPAGYLGSADRFISNTLSDFTTWKESWQSLS